MINCKDCGWNSTSSNECDAEVEFTNHIVDSHMKKSNIDEKLRNKISKNINIEQFAPEKNDYAIYVNSSSVGYYGKMLFPDDINLQNKCKCKLKSLALAIELAKEIREYTGLLIYKTKGIYGDRVYVGEVI
jgi:hypothetical protein